MATATELINEGNILLENNDISQAIEKFKEAIALEPNNEDHYYYWRAAILKMDDPKKELTAYRKAVEDTLDSIQSEYDLARLYLDLENWRQANQMFKRVAERNDPAFNYLNTYINWGYSLDKIEEYQKAISKYKKAIEIDPQNELAYRNWRSAIKQLEDPSEEIKYYLSKIEANMHQAAAFHDFGYMLIDLKRYKEAIGIFEKAYNFNEAGYDYGDLLINWGFCLDRLHDYEGAIQQYRSAARTGTENKVLYSNWQAAILKLDHPEKWSEEYRQLIEDKYPTADGYYLTGYLFIMTREFDQAMAYFEKSLALNEDAFDYTFLYINWGYCLSSKYKLSKASEKYQKAIELDPGSDLAFSNWAFAIGPESSEEDIAAFQKSIQPQLHLARYNCILGIALNNARKFDESLKYFYKAIDLDTTIDDIWYYFGNALMSTFHYDEAVMAYQKALALTPNYVFAAHNYAHLLEKLGRFKLSKEEWRKTLNLYKSLEHDKFHEDKDSDFFYYYGSIYHEAFKELDTAESLYLKGLELNKENVFIMLNMVKLYLTRKNEAIEAGEESSLLKNNAHAKSWQYFRHAERLLKEQIQGGEEVVNLLNTLGELYLMIDKADQAKEVFDKALAADPENVSTLAGLGVYCTRKENYKEALRYFNEALIHDPDSLSLQNNYAEALLRNGNIYEAEKAYHRIQGVSSNHIESLIGLAEIYKKFGDTALDRGIRGDAEEMFNQADYYYNRVLNLEDHPEKSSKKLTSTELSGVFYSKGYVNVKMFELNSNVTHLLTARSNFKKVNPVGTDYYKARRAISKIDDRTRSVREASSKFGSVIIIVFSCILLVAIQWAFFIGKPVYERETVTLTNDLSKLFNLNDPGDQALLEKLQPFTGETFYSREQLDAALKKNLTGQELERLSELPTIREGGKMKLQKYDPIDATSYGLLTFGALIFIAAGIYLREITKLKFGVIEMEKSSFDQISTTSSLEISKGGSDISSISR